MTDTPAHPREIARLKRLADDRRERAKRLMIHYFELAGAVTNTDNRAELGELVDLLIDAAVLTMQSEEAR